MNALQVLVGIATLSVYAVQSPPENADHSRQKRYLIFPRGNPTRHQLVAGFGIPVDIVLESVTVGYVFKAVYFLPWNSSHWVPQFLRRDEDDLFQLPEEQQQLQAPQRRNFVQLNPDPYWNQADVNDEQSDGDNWVYRARWTIYRTLEAIADHKGFNGRHCLLRTICESAEAKFGQSSGILGELLHILFTPSTSDDPTDETDTLHEEYKKAERLPHNTSPRFSHSVCSDMFTECPISWLNLFTGIVGVG
ncbi:uncharacterized protein LOC129729186 [Wyeomyia smithii]|uniref:uncharacterized protein LOC129729186 n=1 Tax=Wyeomyia smithii TaxID=174621 RepID=UPI002467EBDB|nr:uncharacterized protein LOC129729186 [Wyeomyia smithii]